MTWGCVGGVASLWPVNEGPLGPGSAEERGTDLCCQPLRNMPTFSQQLSVSHSWNIPSRDRCPPPPEVSPGLCPPHPLFHSDAAFETKCPYHRLLSTCSSCTCDDTHVVSLAESSVLGVRLHGHLEGTCLLALTPCHKPPTHALHKACAQLARWFVFTQQPRRVGRREVGGGSQAPQPQGGPRGLARDQDDRCVLGLVSAQLGT